jgi:hypothetical protein
MKPEFVLEKLIDLLGELSDADLINLGALLRQPDVHLILAKLIESTLALREAERRSRKLGHGKLIRDEILQEDSPTGTARIIDNDVRQKGSLKEAVRYVGQLLADRNLFPSTKDVVTAINAAFDLKMRYEEFRKRGRRDLIERWLTYVGRMPESEQWHRFEAFVKQMPANRFDTDQYRNLFRILTKNE